MNNSTFYKIKKNAYQFFLLKLVVLCFALFLFDFAIGSILNYFYFKQESGFQYRTTYSIEKTNADVLTFGSSRANHHYHPKIFETRLKMSFYNVGRDGYSIIYHYAILKSVLKRYTPKIIILDFNYREFRKSQDDYDRISTLLPYYKKHPEIQQIIEIRSKYEKYKLVSSIYPYNSLFFTILMGNMEFNKNRQSDSLGYIPLYKRWDEPIKPDSNPTEYEFDTTKIRMYDEFIKDCIISGTQLYIVCSPYYRDSNQDDSSIKMGKEIARRNNIMFFDCSEDSLFKANPKLFADISHLNNEGAKIFSNMIIDKINISNGKNQKVGRQLLVIDK